MNWKITGIDRETGKASVSTLSAPTEDFAVKLAGEKGLLVEKIEPIAQINREPLEYRPSSDLPERPPSVGPDYVMAIMFVLIGIVCAVFGGTTIETKDGGTQSVYSISSAVFSAVFWILASLTIIDGRLRRISWNLDRLNRKD